MVNLLKYALFDNILAMLHYKAPVFFDLETSGTDQCKHQITQIAAMHLPTGDSYEQKLRFSLRKADPEALEVIGFSKRKWKNAVSQRDGMVSFCDFVANHKSCDMISKKGNPYTTASLIGYRIDRFDLPFLAHHFDKHDLWFPGDFRCYDSMQLALWALPGRSDYTLSAVAEELGVFQEGAHDALVDVEMTINVTAILIDHLNLPKPEWVDNVLADL